MSGLALTRKRVIKPMVLKTGALNGVSMFQEALETERP